VEISDLVADRVADLRGWDLIVVNAAGGSHADTGAAAAGLRAALDVVPLAAHEHAGRPHPLLWTRVRDNTRIVTDLLGHDERSYDSAAHRELISRAARWLTRAL
jgi:hypothetical protein